MLCRAEMASNYELASPTPLADISNQSQCTCSLSFDKLFPNFFSKVLQETTKESDEMIPICYPGSTVGSRAPDTLA